MTAVATVADIALVRSKNAGPFWLTFDIFCDTPGDFACVCKALDNARVARALQADEAALRRFEIADLKALKFSLPRPHTQGGRTDRDMHGASFAQVLAELTV